jgi:hypothetical protein
MDFPNEFVEIKLDRVTADLVRQLAIQLALPPARIRELAFQAGIEKILCNQPKRS